MSMIKQMALRIPGMKALQRQIWRRDAERQLRLQSAEEVFAQIYQDNAWDGQESRSGTGSDSSQTQTIAQALPKLIHQFNVNSILDAPCGDFQWMKDVKLAGVNYVGADIVPQIAELNQTRYGSDSRQFRTLDLIEDTIPEVDLIFCRDCLVHLSHEDVFRSLQNICASRSKYLLTTTFPTRTQNDDILTGQWRVLNLELTPFHFPSPLELIDERCTEGDGAYQDKSLGLWRLSDIRNAMVSLQEGSVAK